MNYWGGSKVEAALYILTVINILLLACLVAMPLITKNIKEYEEQKRINKPVQPSIYTYDKHAKKIDMRG